MSKYILKKMPDIYNNLLKQIPKYPKPNKSKQSGGYDRSNKSKENEVYFVNHEYKQQCANYPYTPTILPAQPRIIVLGDIHGDYKLAITLLKLGRVIDDNNNWIGGSTYVVQAGDQIDSCRPVGPMTCDKAVTTMNDRQDDIKILELFNELDKQARQHHGKVISLLGNHELMNIEGELNYVSRNNMKMFKNYKDNIHPDIKFKSAKEARTHAFAPANEIGVMLGCTRLPCVVIGSNLFVHAGIINRLIDKLEINENSDLESISIALRQWLLGLISREYVGKIINATPDSMFWTRVIGMLPPGLPLNDPKCVDNVGKAMKVLNVDAMFVAHTPQAFINNTGVNATCGETIWRIDMGSAETFDKFDTKYMHTGHRTHSRRPQVVEILNDNIYNVISNLYNVDMTSIKTNDPKYIHTEQRSYNKRQQIY